jgi:hypothetical protein
VHCFSTATNINEGKETVNLVGKVKKAWADKTGNHNEKKKKEG